MLEDIKILLGIPDGDTSLDAKLKLILSITTNRLKALLGGEDPPEELNYIITDVAIIRYNKIGSEGVSSHTVEGESLSFSDDDFAGYRDDIQDYLDRQKEVKKGKVRFL
nr:phage head-tail connector protein [uncultured Anaerostipes sp.]